MILFDAVIRFTGVGLLVLLATFTVRDLRKWHGAPYLFLSCVTVLAAYLGLTIEPFRLPKLAHLIVRILDIPHLIFVWLFALSLFNDSFKLRWFHLCVGIIYCIPILVMRLYHLEVISQYPHLFVSVAEVFSIVLMAHLIYTTLRGRTGDLLEKRRRARLYFVIIIVFVASTATFIGTDVFLPHIVAYETIWIASIWPGILWTCYWLLGANRLVLAFGKKEPKQASINKQEKDWLSKLEKIMIAEEAYKDSNLTIVMLAQKMAMTQHRLRSLINQSLGHQNFNGFVNSYRISAIKKALSDSEQNHLPILTLALDHGFNSLSPFNRAFRESENMTPSEFRLYSKNL